MLLTKCNKIFLLQFFFSIFDIIFELFLIFCTSWIIFLTHQNVFYHSLNSSLKEACLKRFFLNMLVKLCFQNWKLSFPTDKLYVHELWCTCKSIGSNIPIDFTLVLYFIPICLCHSCFVLFLSLWHRQVLRKRRVSSSVKYSSTPCWKHPAVAAW